jgi:hypothetical protein
MDLSGEKTVKVRYAETLTTEAGVEVLLLFTDILVSAAPLADYIIVDTTSNSISVYNVTAGDIVTIYNKSGVVQGQAVTAPDSNYPQYIYATVNLTNLPHTGTYNVSVTSIGKSESVRVEKKYVRQPSLNIYYGQNELQVSAAEPGAKLYPINYE